MMWRSSLASYYGKGYLEFSRKKNWKKWRQGELGTNQDTIWPLRWGTLCLWTPTGSKMANRQSWKCKRNPS